jgi:putative DNA primase/helicase
VADTDTAFWRRWIIVEFPNYFPPESRDPTLEGCLTSDENLSGVLNWAIEGYNRLMCQGQFTNIETTADETRRLWQSWGESVEEFIVECLKCDTKADNISTNALYQVYREWCRSEGKHRMNQRKLTNTVSNDGTDFGYKTSVRTIDLDYPDNGYTACGFTDESPDLQEVLAEDNSEATDNSDANDDTRNRGLGEY